VSAYDQLLDDLWSIYFAAGREVTYVGPDGERRAYWAQRYRLLLEEAAECGDAVAFAERLMREPSDGFGRLARASRLDLTVEALGVDPTKPYHQLFDPEAVRAARERLKEAAYAVPTAG
jgi:hypothetical protein